MTGKNRALGGKAMYLCETRWKIGPSFCAPSNVKEGEIVSLLIDAVETRFLSPRAERRVDTKGTCRSKPPKATREIIECRQEIKALEESLAHAEEGLLKVDYDLFDIVQREYRRLRSQRVKARAVLRDLEAAAGIGPPTAHPQADRVTRWLTGLHEAIRTANRPVMKQLFREIVDHIDVWTAAYPRYEQTWYRLDRAVIHFGESLGNLVVRCPEDVPLPPSSSAIPHAGSPRKRALRKARRFKRWLEARRAERNAKARPNQKNKGRN
jgi:hypothetical protein